MKLPLEPDRQEALNALRVSDAIMEFVEDSGSVTISEGRGWVRVACCARWTNWQAYRYSGTSLYDAFTQMQRIKRQWEQETMTKQETTTISEYLRWKRHHEAIKRRWQALVYICVFGFMLNVMVGLAALYLKPNPAAARAATVVAVLCFIATPFCAWRLGKMNRQ